MRTSDLIRAMEFIAPLSYAEDWDNVGLLIGDASRELSVRPGSSSRPSVLLTIDLTESVIDEAVSSGASAVLAYHPPIFHPLKRVTSAGGRERVVLRAIEAGLAVYSPHTALDAAPGGMADWLSDGLLDRAGVVKADRRALAPRAIPEETQEVKIVTFVPHDAAERVREGLATAGAGIIGAYRLCSFSVSGTGTFFGTEGTSPAAGQAGRLETVHETRLEMVCSRKALPLAIETLRQFHPYEEPAIDVYTLLGKPVRAVGPGRRLVLDRPASLEKLAARIKTHLGVSAVKVAQGRLSGGTHAGTPGGMDGGGVTYVGVCPGAGASLVPAAIADGCEVYVTGEMKHHEVLAAVEAGVSIILAGHTNTERGYLPVLAQRLGAELPGASFLVSRADRNPLVLM